MERGAREERKERKERREERSRTHNIRAMGDGGSCKDIKIHEKPRKGGGRRMRMRKWEDQQQLPSTTTANLSKSLCFTPSLDSPNCSCFFFLAVYRGQCECHQHQQWWLSRSSSYIRTGQQRMSNKRHKKKHTTHMHTKHNTKHNTKHSHTHTHTTHTHNTCVTHNTNKSVHG